MEDVRVMNVVVSWACIGLYLCRLQCETKSRLWEGGMNYKNFHVMPLWWRRFRPRLSSNLLVFSRAGGGIITTITKEAELQLAPQPHPGL